MTEQKKDKIFPDGFFIEKKEGTPDFLIGSLSINVAKAIPFLQAHEKKSGYVNIDIKESLGGKLYCELDTWVPKQKDEVKEKVQGAVPMSEGIEYPEEENNQDIPF